PAPTRRALIAAPPVVLRGLVPLIPAAAPATDRNSRHEHTPYLPPWTVGAAEIKVRAMRGHLCRPLLQPPAGTSRSPRGRARRATAGPRAPASAPNPPARGTGPRPS